ncbi:GM22825 [Drosophila sechellia]|uniref:GM22825 n=1 Tax=Drosophila sechellia TaxID=7238 RepID=B4I6Q5_DROSE|nr:GM22825 [Drosophila sechellia]
MATAQTQTKMEPVGGWWMVDTGCWMLGAECRCRVLDTGAGWWSIDDDRRSEGMQLLIRFDCDGGGNRWSEINSLTRYQN